MTQPRRYKAFISYSHADSAHASWLQRALERYRPPKERPDRVVIEIRVDRVLGRA